MRYLEPCGCKHNGIEWLVMCETHRAETDATSARWKAERAAGVVVTHTSYHGQAFKALKPIESTDWLDCPSSAALPE